VKISVVFEALTGRFETDTKRATKTMQKEMDKLKKDAAIAGKAIGLALVAGIGIAATAIKSSIDAMDDLSKAAKTVGMDTEGFSRLAYAADLANVSQEELQSGLGRLVKAQAAAMDQSSQQAKTFEALGIAVKNADGSMRSTHDVMLDFADAFKELKGSPEALAAGLSIFGRGFQTFVPLINDGAQAIVDLEKEADALGVTLSTEAGENAERFNDNITRLTGATKGLVRQVAEELLPDLLELSEEFVASAKNGDRVSEVAQDIADGFRVLALAGKIVVGVFQFLVDAAQATVDAFIGVYKMQQSIYKAVSGDFKGAQADFAAAMRQGQAVRDDFAETASNIGLGGDRGTPAGKPVEFMDPPPPRRSRASASRLRDVLGGDDKKSGGKKKTGLDDAAKEAKRLEEQYQSLNASMAENIALFGNTTEVAKVRYDLEHGELAKLSEEKKQQLLDQASTLDLLAKEKEFLDERNKAEEEKLKLHADAQEAVAQLLEDMQFELDLMGKTNAERIAANELRRIGIGLTDEEIAAAQKSIEAKAQELEQQQRLVSAMDEFRQGFEDNLTDVLTGAKSIGDAFKSMADLVVQQIARMIAQQWTSQLFGAPGSSGFGSAGSPLAALFGSFLPGHAGGTDYALGGMAWVGERGRELVQLPRGSRVIPNHEIERNARGGQVVQNNQFITQGRPTEASQRQQAQKAGRAVRRAEVY
jgi:hypothetical protein